MRSARSLFTADSSSIFALSETRIASKARAKYPSSSFDVAARWKSRLPPSSARAGGRRASARGGQPRFPSGGDVERRARVLGARFRRDARLAQGEDRGAVRGEQGSRRSHGRSAPRTGNPRSEREARGHGDAGRPALARAQQPDSQSTELHGGDSPALAGRR